MTSGMKQSLHRITFLFLLAAGILEIIAFVFRPFEGYDSGPHIFWIIEWHKLSDAGISYARWLPDYFMGYGSPTFYFYPPLPYFISNLIYFFHSGFSPDN